MAMFDNVNFKANCPNCGHKLEDFQTYYGHRIFETVEYDTVPDFHDICDNCGAHCEFIVVKTECTLLRLLKKLFRKDK